MRVLGVLLGGSWVVLSGVVSKATIVITHIRGLFSVLITTHEPPSRETLRPSAYRVGSKASGSSSTQNTSNPGPPKCQTRELGTYPKL